MKEHPIIFKSEMVKAILEGRKTMTRRIVKPQPPQEAQACTCGNIKHFYTRKNWTPQMACEATCDLVTAKPSYQVGDRLWVREKTRVIDVRYYPNSQDIRVRYEADEIETDWQKKPERIATLDRRKCISRGCYKELARILLEVTDVRVERVQDITEEDIEKEGLFCAESTMDAYAIWIDLWDSINAKRGYSWESNPYVWVYSFRRLKGKL